MSGKITRLAFQQLIAEDIAWLEAQPRTLEREHIIGIVRESERYYYVDAQDGAISAARGRALRPLEQHERMFIRGAFLNGEDDVVRAVQELLERRQGHA
jgi:hypothetical protein